MSVFLPQTIGDYRVIAQLGQGGMARALLAMRRGPGGFRKLFVLKKLREDLSTESEFVEMFLNEARLAAMLSHPNVVQTHEVGYDQDSCFFSMDYLEGQSLSRVLRRVGRSNMPLCLHVFVLSDVLAGLQYAHRLTDFDGSPLAIVHRDISPGNIFIGYDGQIKLLDFGIAKAAGAKFETKVGVLKGKLAYMAPEQALTQDVDQRSDLFSVGVLLWEALAGQRMIKSSEPEPVTLQNRVQGNWPGIGEVNPSAPPTLIAACDRALAVNPDDRFSTAEEFRGALAAYLETCAEEPSREGLAALVSAQFIEERQQLSAEIAAKIDSGAPATINESLLAHASSTTIPPFQAWDESKNVDIEVVPQLGPQLGPQLSPQEPSTTLSAGMLRPSRRGLYVIGAGAVGISLILIVALAALSDKDERPAETSAAETSAASQDESPGASDGSAKDQRINLSVIATPASATISLDGNALANPGKTEVVRDLNEHQVVISADGYEAETRTVRFDHDVVLEVVLSAKALVSRDDKKPRSARAKRRSERRKAKARRDVDSSAASVDAAGAGDAGAVAATLPDEAPSTGRTKAGDVLKRPKGKKKRRVIDQENPYK